MQRRGIGPLDLTEHDQWVNETTREDLAELAKDPDVFGLKMWDWKFVPAEELRGAKNFQVDMVFDKGHEQRVRDIIGDYESSTEPTLDAAHFTIHRLCRLATYVCIWV